MRSDHCVGTNRCKCEAQRQEPPPHLPPLQRQNDYYHNTYHSMSNATVDPTRYEKELGESKWSDGCPRQSKLGPSNHEEDETEANPQSGQCELAPLPRQC